MKRKASQQYMRPIKRQRVNKPKKKSLVSVYQAPIKPIKEKKSVDVNTATYALNTTGSVTLLNGLGQGTDLNNLLGRKANFKSIECTYGLEYIRDQTSLDYGRVLLIYDKQPNGSLPTIPDILLDLDVGGTSSTDPYSGINLDNRNRFIVIRDMRLMLPKVNTAATLSFVFPSNKDELFGHIYRAIGLETIYNGVGQTITGIDSGSILLVTLGTIASGSEAWSLRFKCRLRYQDNI